MGYWHEQSRPDRDEHVQIVWDNIPEGMQGAICKGYIQGLITTTYRLSYIIATRQAAVCDTNAVSYGRSLKLTVKYHCSL